MNKIACMIVTYNRRELLCRLLDELDKQTCQDFDILVLNNGSQDDTFDFLSERQKVTNKNLIIETVPVNKGMAYGYNRGYAAVFERGYEWIWTMDDDGLPEEHQLEKLLEAQQETGLKYLNSIVCNIENPHELAFSLADIKDPTNVDVKYIYGTVRPDNGTLINREIYEKCGNIKSELMSYGMETEFVYRVKRAGYDVATVCNAMHFHPVKPDKRTAIINVGSFRKWYVYDPSFLGENGYCAYLRAFGYIMETYQKERANTELYRLIFYWITRMNLSNICKYTKEYNRGRKNIFPRV